MNAAAANPEDDGRHLPKVKAFNEELRAALEAYQERNNRTLAELGVELDSNATQVSRYIAKKPLGDVERLEKIIGDVLRNEERRKHVCHALFHTHVSKEIASYLNTIKETNDFGLIFSGAGEGKTSAIALFCREHPATIVLTASEWARDSRAIERLLWDAVNTSQWSGNTKRSLFLVNHLRDSNRLILVDNAHRLDTTGLRYLFDFADETRCPVSLIGNPELLTKIEKNDQMFSRIGLKQEVKAESNPLKAAVRDLLDALCPDDRDELMPLAQVVAEERGRLRALRKQVHLMQKLQAQAQKAGKPLSAVDAFRMAHTKLIRAYSLKEGK